MNTSWRDIDPNGGDGVGVHIVVNGNAIYSANVPNGGATSDMRTISFLAGDIVDFVVEPGPNEDQNFDATGIKIVITRADKSFS